jgi:hypothetical protein
MTSAQLIDMLWDKVFSWVGLPVQIIGDRDTRLTADRMRALKLASLLKVLVYVLPSLHLIAPVLMEVMSALTKHYFYASYLLPEAAGTKGSWDRESPSLLYDHNNTAKLLLQDIHHTFCYLVETLST